MLPPPAFCVQAKTLARISGKAVTAVSEKAYVRKPAQLPHPASKADGMLIVNIFVDSRKDHGEWLRYTTDSKLLRIADRESSATDTNRQNYDDSALDECKMCQSRYMFLAHCIAKLDAIECSLCPAKDLDLSIKRPPPPLPDKL